MSNYDTTDMQNKSCTNATASPVKYRCAACGVVHESDCGTPKSCCKCDCERFYQVK